MEAANRINGTSRNEIIHGISCADCIINASNTDFLTEKEPRSFIVSRAYSLLHLRRKKLCLMQKEQKIILSKKITKNIRNMNLFTGRIIHIFIISDIPLRAPGQLWSNR